MIVFRKETHLRLKGRRRVNTMTRGFVSTVLLIGGGFKVHPGGKICHITCAGGVAYTLYGVVDGYMIEINERVINEPEILLKYVTQQ